MYDAIVKRATFTMDHRSTVAFYCAGIWPDNT